VRKSTFFTLRDPAPGDPARPSSTPIHQTATFEQEEPDRFGRFDYSRSGNPTRAVLEDHCARLEGAAGSLACASGMAAITLVFRLLKPGDAIVVHRDLYGGTQRLLGRIALERGIEVRREDLVDGDLEALAASWSDRTRLVFVESLSNPTWRAPDLRRLARVAHARGALLAVDATAMSPWLQRPIEHGADLVVHSATKLLAGHADTTAGIVATRDASLHDELAFLHNAEGLALGPFDAWLVLRGMKTLGVRIERQQASARTIALALADLRDRGGWVRSVHYVGLDDHPDARRHAAQADGPGVVLSFETGDPDRSKEIVARLRLASIAVSFGSVDTTASLPCFMSHASVPAGHPRPPRDLVRLSIGLEDPLDVLDDLVGHGRRSARCAIALVDDGETQRHGEHRGPQRRPRE
jgi:cystathionine beta-lyase